MHRVIVRPLPESRPRHGGARGARCRAFSMLELVFVMLIMAGVMALAVPSLRGFGESRQVRDAAGSVLALAKYARFRAVCDGREYRLYVEPERGRCWLETAGTEGYERLASSFGQVFYFPGTVIVEWYQSDAVRRRGYVAFQPNGRCNVACLRMTGRLGTVVELCCESPGELFRLREVFDTGVRRG